ncbi:MAG: transposase, partial [Bacillota bacterium]
MYLRTVRVKRESKVFEYVQLAHNYRDRETGRLFVKVLYSFGRVDQLDTDALRRLVRSISRYLEPSEAEVVRERLGEEWPFEFLGSRRIGGSWLLDGLWKRLGVDKVPKGLLGGRGYTTPVERLLFAMVANRTLAPLSKLGMERWVAEETLIDGLPEVEVHQLYR